MSVLADRATRIRDRLEKWHRTDSPVALIDAMDAALELLPEGSVVLTRDEAEKVRLTLRATMLSLGTENAWPDEWREALSLLSRGQGK